MTLKKMLLGATAGAAVAAVSVLGRLSASDSNRAPSLRAGEPRAGEPGAAPRLSRGGSNVAVDRDTITRAPAGGGVPGGPPFRGDSGRVGPVALPVVGAQPEVEHRSSIDVGGRKITFLKIRNPDGTLAERILEGTKTLSADEALAILRGPYLEFGRIHPHLARRLETAAASYPVRIWLAVPALELLTKPERADRLDVALASLEQAHRDNLARFATAKLEFVRRAKLDRSEFVADLAGSPFVRAVLSPDRIRELAESPAVRMLLLDDEDATLDLANSLAISGADDVQADGIDGTDVNVAVWESGPATPNTLVVSGAYSAFAGIVPSRTNHARNVSGIVQGYAPGAALFSADSTNLVALDWAIDTARASSINQSFHRGSEINDGMSSDDLYKDYRVLHFPWPFISQAAGNWCAPGSPCYEAGNDVTDEFVNHKGFNSISIANHDDTATAMSASSCFVNPTSPRGDRELPELAANGTSVTAETLQMGGTSMASPAVTGSAALLQDAVPVLVIWPEGVRALLLAGAVTNVATHNGTLSDGVTPAASAGSTWWNDVRDGNDGFDGAGALHVERSHLISGSRRSAAEGPMTRAWDIGTMTDLGFDRNRFFRRTYQVQIPSRSRGPRAVRVALAWNSHATVRETDPADVYTSTLDMDLDLRVYDEYGVQVARSLSWDNSYEVVDFQGDPGRVYTIKVHRWSAASASSWSWFGIAWDVR